MLTIEECNILELLLDKVTTTGIVAHSKFEQALAAIQRERAVCNKDIVEGLVQNKLDKDKQDTADLLKNLERPKQDKKLPLKSVKDDA